MSTSFIREAGFALRCALAAVLALHVVAPSETDRPPSDREATSPTAYARLINGRGVTTPVAVTMPHLKYYGGRVISNLKVQPVLWSQSTYWTTGTPSVQAQLDAFYSAYAPSTAYSWMSEYGTNIPGGTNQALNPGTAAPSVIITPASSNLTIAPTTIVSELQRQLSLGTLATPDGDTLYVVHMPPGSTVTDGVSTSCQQYCGYHYSTTTTGGVKVPFAVIPDFSPGSACVLVCGESTAAFDNMTATVSHEIAEAVTDPDVGTSREGSCGPTWCDPAQADSASDHAEIGDCCESGLRTQGTFKDGNGVTHTVQRLWSNSFGACMTTAAEAFSVTVTPVSGESGYLAAPGTVDFTVTTTAPSTATTNQALLNVYSLPPGMTPAFDTSRIPPGGSTTLHVSLDNTAPLDWTIGVGADNGDTLAIGTAPIGFDDFTGTASGPVSLRAGGTGTVTVSTTLTKGNPPLQISAQALNLPGGITASFAPASFNAGSSTTVTFSAAAGTQSGTPNLVVQLTGGRRTVSVAVNSTISGDDFTATASGTDVTVDRGRTATLGIATTTSNGNPQPLTFSVDGLPNGVTDAFSPTTVNSGASTTLTFTAANDADLGPATLTVHVVGAVGTTIDLPVNLTVNPAPGCGCNGSGSSFEWVALAVGLSFVARRGRSRFGGQPRPLLLD